MAKFDYIAPSTIHECLKVLSEDKRACVFAGGTDLLVKIRNRVINPKLLVDIKKINTMAGIQENKEGIIWISPLTTHSEMENSPLILKKYPFLSRASRWVGSKQIRNRGTIGGNICNGSPSAETLPPLYVLEVKLYLKGLNSKRIVPVDEFYEGPQKTYIKQGEILASIEIPPIKGKYKGIYLRNARRNAVDIANVTCAILMQEDLNTSIGKRFKIALGAVAPTVVRAKSAENYLNSSLQLDVDVIKVAAQMALKDISPIDDIRTTCNYRKDIVFTLVKRGLLQLIYKGEDE